ncbi:MAG TPA: site-2 protease family protein [Burkholderiaceae bacterium]
MNDIIQTIAVYAIPVLFAITLHEAAHAYAAKYFGDNTAYAQGRMTLDPFKHIDLFGTIVLPILTFVTTGFVLGSAKPVPVEFSRLRNPKKQMAFVALAGPGANLFMALLWMLFGVLLAAFGSGVEFFYQMVKAGITVNLLFFAFNLFPLPPLDGGRVLTSMLPDRLAYKFARIEPYGFFILLGLLMLGVLKYWVTPLMMLANTLLRLLISPLTFLLT